MSRFAKDPDARLDYQVDWSNWLPTGDTIDSHSIAVVDGDVVIDAQSANDTSITAWITGGTVKTVSSIRFRITTVQGRTDDRTITIEIENR